jgi:hypothetical protein
MGMWYKLASNFITLFLLQGYNELKVKVLYEVDIFNIVLWNYFFHVQFNTFN